MRWRIRLRAKLAQMVVRVQIAPAYTLGAGHWPHHAVRRKLPHRIVRTDTLIQIFFSVDRRAKIRAMADELHIVLTSYIRAHYVLLCGVMWAQHASRDACEELFRVLRSDDPDVVLLCKRSN